MFQGESNLKLKKRKEKITDYDKWYDYIEINTGEKINSYNKQMQLIADFEELTRADAVINFIEWIIGNNQLPKVIQTALRELAEDYIS